jgi:hypothetical protein
VTIFDAAIELAVAFVISFEILSKSADLVSPVLSISEVADWLFL